MFGYKESYSCIHSEQQRIHSTFSERFSYNYASTRSLPPVCKSLAVREISHLLYGPQKKSSLLFISYIYDESEKPLSILTLDTSDFRHTARYAVLFAFFKALSRDDSLLPLLFHWKVGNSWKNFCVKERWMRWNIPRESWDFFNDILMDLCIVLKLVNISIRLLCEKLYFRTFDRWIVSLYSYYNFYCNFIVVELIWLAITWFANNKVMHK